MKLGLVLAAVFLCRASAATPDTVFLEDLTWTEVRELLRAGTRTILLPTGGTEQNGPHIVIGKHNYRVRFAAERIARKLGKTLVAPVLPFAPEGEFNMKFPGTIDLPDEYFLKVIEHAARSLKRHGFRDIFIIRDSGSNREAMMAMLKTLNAEWKDSETRIHMVPEYRSNGFDAWLIEQGESKPDIGLHAGVLDTSLIMAVDPKHIRRDKLRDRDSFEGSVDGNPARASEAYGRKGVAMMIDASVTRIRELVAAPRAKN